MALPPLATDETRALRARLLGVVARTVRDPRVLQVVGRMPRHVFAPDLT
ncbi:MAG: protein-L-isoaspartate O-methyltransferase, partial [Polyangiaceae bacterium]|nr:protein-L-isoaspartate O-methyltransferase [Polyangiaceae bacterium]